MSELPDLLSIPGISAVVLLITQFIIKPLLARRIGLPPYGDETAVKKADFSLWVNIASVALGLCLGVVAQLLLEGDLALTGAVLLVACLRGFMGGVGAIGGYEVGKNVLKLGGGGSKQSLPEWATRIVVNGSPYDIVGAVITYEALTAVADFTGNPTIVYRKGPQMNPEGTLTPGNYAYIQPGMIFDIAHTGNA